MLFVHRTLILLTCLTCGLSLGCESESSTSPQTSDVSVNADGAADGTGDSVAAGDIMTSTGDGLG